MRECQCGQQYTGKDAPRRVSTRYLLTKELKRDPQACH